MHLLRLSEGSEHHETLFKQTGAEHFIMIRFAQQVCSSH